MKLKNAKPALTWLVGILTIFTATVHAASFESQNLVVQKYLELKNRAVQSGLGLSGPEKMSVYYIDQLISAHDGTNNPMISEYKIADLTRIKSGLCLNFNDLEAKEDVSYPLKKEGKFLYIEKKYRADEKYFVGLDYVRRVTWRNAHMADRGYGNLGYIHRPFYDKKQPNDVVIGTYYCQIDQ